MKKSIITLAAILFLSYLLITKTHFIKWSMSKSERERTERACRYGSEITKRGFIGTQFEDFDFYESCLDNAYNTSPYSRRPDAK